MQQVGGGDVTRKKKLLEVRMLRAQWACAMCVYTELAGDAAMLTQKQKEGKKRMKMVGNVELDQDVFLSLMRSDFSSNPKVK